MKWKKGMLIYNTNAGKGKVEKNLANCLPVLATNLERLLVLQTFEPGDALRLCLQFGEDMDVAFILGGDGTVHECINGLSQLKNRPVVGILPAGTCNDFSRTLGIPQNLSKAAETMVSGKVKDIDVAKTGENYFLNFWGIGLITETSNNIDPGEKNFLGKVSYLLSAARTIGNNEPFSFRMVYDNQTLEDEAVMVLVVNGNHIGANRLPFPLISAEDGLLDVIIIKHSNLIVFKEILELKRTFSESLDPESGVMYLQAKSISIETPQKLQADTDGEIYLHTPAEIIVLKSHLRMIHGEEPD
jgi:diacylglycerol kinase (ATP)